MTTIDPHLAELHAAAVRDFRAAVTAAAAIPATEHSPRRQRVGLRVLAAFRGLEVADRAVQAELAHAAMAEVPRSVSHDVGSWQAVSDDTARSGGPSFGDDVQRDLRHLGGVL